MKQCSHCDGFVPVGLSACPHCEASMVPVEPAKKSPAFRLTWKQKVATAVGTGAMMFTLMACYGGPPNTIPSCTQVDNDKDGYYVCAPGETGYIAQEDCNDNDATINPGAVDSDKDGTDQNCDGTDGPTSTANP